jgi:hypothetical protein
MTQVAEPDVIAKRVAGFGLPGHDPSGAVSVSDTEWPIALDLIRSRHIAGLAVAGIEAGWLQLSDDQAADLLNVHRDAMLAPLSVERSLLTLAPAFEEAGVEFVVLKGPSLAHTVYPDPSWRYFGDLDLLVSARAWSSACAVLEGLGFPRDLPEPRRGFDERFGKASVYRSPSGVEIDLHRTLVLGPFSQWVHSEELFQRTTTFLLGGRTFRRLDDTMLMLHACMHASLGWWPPLTVPLRDVLQVAHFGEIDWDGLGEQATRWKLRAVIRDAFQIAGSALRIPLPSHAQDLAASLTPTRKETSALQAYATDQRRGGWEARATLGAIRGLRPKARFILSLAFPSREFLSARAGSGPISYWRRLSSAFGPRARRWRNRGLS